MKKILSFFTRNNDTALAMPYEGVVRFVPLVICGGFFFVTILLHAFGPTDWGIQNPFALYSFLFLCLFALIGGYLLATFKGKTGEGKVNLNAGNILTVGAVVFLLLFFPLCRLTTGKWFPDVYFGITNTGAAYRLTKYYSDIAPNFLFYLRIALSPVLFVVMPITFFFFPKLSKVQKALGISTIALNVALGIAQGVNKHVADLCMQLILVLIILLFCGGKKTKKERLIYCAKILALILVICALFVLYYWNSMNNRVATDIQLAESGEISEEKLEENLSKKPRVDTEKLNATMGSYATFSTGKDRNWAFWNAVLPGKLKPAANFLISYFCHGYNGLSYAMEEEFTSSYGLGFSDFIRHNAMRFFGGTEAEENIYARTYMAKIEEQGWQTGPVWSSFFIFPASDISFPGTILLVFIIGYLFGLSWKDTLCTQNPFACAVFLGFSTMVFYFSANNQMFQGGENCTAFCALLLLWILSRIFTQREKNV